MTARLKIVMYRPFPSPPDSPLASALLRRETTIRGQISKHVGRVRLLCSKMLFEFPELDETILCVNYLFLIMSASATKPKFSLNAHVHPMDGPQIPKSLDQGACIQMTCIMQIKIKDTRFLRWSRSGVIF